MLVQSCLATRLRANHLPRTPPIGGESSVPSFLGGSHNGLIVVQGAIFVGPRREGYLMAGLYVREGDNEEGPGPFEGLNPLPNGSLGKPLPLLSIAHHFFFFFFDNYCFR